MSNLYDFYNARAQFLDNDGNPVTSGAIEFYTTGTSTLTEVYTDALGAVPAENPQPLDAGGYLSQSNLYLKPGAYKLVLRDADGQEIWTRDPLTTENIFAEGLLEARFYDTVVNLQEVIPSSSATVAYASGYYASGDRGGGFFVWSESSTATPDAGSILAATPTPSTGRWLRVFDAGDIYPELWGAIPGSTSVAADGPIYNALTYGANNNKQLVFQSGVWYITGDFVFNLSNIRIKEGARFGRLGTSSISVTITGGDNTVIESHSAIISNGLTLNTAGKLEANPVWWQAPDTTGMSDLIAWRNMSQGNSCPVMLDRDWDLDVAGSLLITIDIPKLLIDDTGSINASSGKSIINITDIDYRARRTTKVFRGDMAAYKIVGTAVPIRVSYWELPDASTGFTSPQKWLQFMSAITDGLAYNRKVIWDKGTYSFSATSFSTYAADIDTASYKLYHTFEPDTTITLASFGSSRLGFGYIDTNNKSQLFLGEGLPGIIGNVNAEWFGLTRSTASDITGDISYAVAQSVALNKAAACLSRDAHIDLGGGYYVTTNLIFTDTYNTTSVDIRNGTLISHADTTGTYISTSDVVLELRDIIISSISSSGVTTTIDFVLTGFDVPAIIDHCNISGSLINMQGTSIIKDSVISGTLRGGFNDGRRFIVENCLINDSLELYAKKSYISSNDIKGTIISFSEFPNINNNNISGLVTITPATSASVLQMNGNVITNLLTIGANNRIGSITGNTFIGGQILIDVLSTNPSGIILTGASLVTSGAQADPGTIVIQYASAVPMSGAGNIITYDTTL